MEIGKINNRGYDARHIESVRPETARSIKPNVFPEITSEVQLALWLTDLVELSPEAMQWLKKFKDGKLELLEEADWKELLKYLRGNLGKGEIHEKESERLNLITLPVMRPPLQEILPRDGGTKKRKAPRSRAREILPRMIVRSPNSASSEKLASELEPLGLEMIEACARFGVRIVILSRGERLSDLRLHGMMIATPEEKTIDGRLKDEVRGMYFEDRRLVVIGEELLGISGRLTSVHEFAHAYDHTFSEKNQRRHHLSTQLWNLFAGSRTAFISAYASSRPAEYFAESVEAFFVGEKRPFLEKHDPKMFEFLSNLFHFPAA